jgi:hypothetical protein
MHAVLQRDLLSTDRAFGADTENPDFVKITVATGLKTARIPLNDTNAQRMRL